MLNIAKTAIIKAVRITDLPIAMLVLIIADAIAQAAVGSAVTS